MNGPRHQDKYGDRFLDCEAELEAEILAVLDRAEAAGWDRAEAVAAIASLADHIALGDMASAQDWHRLREAMKRNRGD